MNVKYRLSKLQSKLKYLKDYEGQLRNEYFSFRKRGLLHVFNVSNSSIALGMVRKDYKNAYFITCVASFISSLYLVGKYCLVIYARLMGSDKFPILMSSYETIICSCSVVMMFVFLLLSEFYKYKYISSLQEEMEVVLFNTNRTKYKIRKLLTDHPVLRYLKKCDMYLD